MKIYKCFPYGNYADRKYNAEKQIIKSRGKLYSFYILSKIFIQGKNFSLVQSVIMHKK